MGGERDRREKDAITQYGREKDAYNTGGREKEPITQYGREKEAYNTVWEREGGL